jgi:hypothetical protein
LSPVSAPAVARVEPRSASQALAAGVVAALAAAWVVLLASYLRHAIVLSADSVNNHVHVWYVARDLWHHGRLPWRMPVLASGDAYAYPYGFVNWTTAALFWPLFGNWTVTLWTALGAVGCIVATFTAFPELRRGWWAAGVLASSAIVESLLFGQQSFAWGSMLVLFGFAAWRRGNRAWAAALVALGQANHAAVVLPMTAIVVAALLPLRPDRRAIVRWYALACLPAIPAIGLVFASPTVGDTSTAQQLANFWGTLGPRFVMLGLPVLAALLFRTGIRAFAPLALVVSMILHVAFQFPLNVVQQWRFVLHPNPAAASLAPLLHDPAFVPGETYRVLRGDDGKLGMYQVLRAGGVLDSELFPESMAIRSFRDPVDYAATLCERGVDRIIHDDTYDWGRRTNEHAMIDELERARVGGVRLHRVQTGGAPGRFVDAVDRSGCP